MDTVEVTKLHEKQEELKAEFTGAKKRIDEIDNLIGKLQTERAVQEQRMTRAHGGWHAIKSVITNKETKDGDSNIQSEEG